MTQLSLVSELSRYGPQAPSEPSPPYADALAYCRHLARGHYENFAVASRLMPRALLPHFYAIYAYCRWADDLADEVSDKQQSRELLDWWESQLDDCFAGQCEHPVFVALARTIEEYSLPRQPLADLLDAFRQDQDVTRYATHAEVLDYCRRSANPVGRLILHLGRCHDDRRGVLADHVCTGLQLANFCQDVASDWQRGRVYLPADTLQAVGGDESMLAAGRCTPQLRRALEIEVDRAESYLRNGEPLIALMPAPLRTQVALFIGGGLSILRSIRRMDYNVWRRRPTVSKPRKLALLVSSWWQTRNLTTKDASP